jgi:hypothetical protein
VSLDVTEHAKPTRAIFAPFMMGHHFGVPFHKELQRWMITEALDHLAKAEKSGDVHRLPITWAKARQEGIAIEKSMGLRS